MDPDERRSYYYHAERDFVQSFDLFCIRKVSDHTRIDKQTKSKLTSNESCEAKRPYLCHPNEKRGRCERRAINKTNF